MLFVLPVVVFILAEKTSARGEEVRGVCVIKDKEQKLEEVEASHRLGGAELDRPYGASVGDVRPESRTIHGGLRPAQVGNADPG